MHLFFKKYVSTVVFSLRVMYHLRLLSPICSHCPAYLGDPSQASISSCALPGGPKEDDNKKPEFGTGVFYAGEKKHRDAFCS